MAAPIETSHSLAALASGEGGNRSRMQERMVGGTEVAMPYVIPVSPYSVLGGYDFVSPVLTVPIVVQDAIATGFLWLINPLGSVVKMAIKRLSYKVNFNALAVDLLPGELRASRVTFTGAASAGLVASAKRDSDFPAAVCSARTLPTGLTALAVVASHHSNLYPTMDLITGGAGHWNQQLAEWVARTEDDAIVLRPGHGLAIWHAAAVTTANRRLIIDGTWDERE